MIEFNQKDQSSNKDIYEELADRESRRNNIVIYQLLELDSSIKGGMERKKVDTKKVDTKKFIDMAGTIDVDIDEEADIKFIAHSVIEYCLVYLL